MKHYDFNVRIAYADTDRMGVVYYANYLVLFERGRTEFLRSIGLRYRDMEETGGLMLPAVESHVEYLAPARYDDLIRVRTFILELGRASVTFGSHIYSERDALIARGHVRLVLVNRSWKPTRFPEDLRQKLALHVGE